MATQDVSQVSSAQLAQSQSVYERKKMGVTDWLLEIIKYAALITLAISFLLPFYWMLSSAVKNDTQVYTVPPIWFPSPQLWGNFWAAWTSENFNLFTVNTVFRYAIPATIGTVFSSAMVAYSFSRIQWIGRDVIFGLVLATMMIPVWVRLVPLYIIFKQLGWLQTFLPLVVPHFFGSAFFIFLLRQFFMALPSELS
ncbi:MAG: carbohydrate ABC transporter permease, partial [Chloroflexota bacterium]